MPKEVHYLLFSRNELKECLCDYAITHAASGADKYCGVDEIVFFDTAEGGVGARVKLRRGDNDELEEREFVASDLVGALLMFCRKCQIPIAQRAHKSAERFGDQLALMMIVDFPRVAPTVEPHNVRYTGADAVEARSRARSV